MHLRNLVYAIASAIALTSFSGCASSRQLVRVADSRAPHPTEALIVVHRTIQLLGAARTMVVVDGDRPIGKVGPGGHLAWTRQPGLCAVNFGLNSDTPFWLPDLYIIDVKAGERYEFKPSFGLSGSDYAPLFPASCLRFTHIQVVSNDPEISAKSLDTSGWFHGPHYNSPYILEDNASPQTSYIIKYTHVPNILTSNHGGDTLVMEVRSVKSDSIVFEASAPLSFSRDDEYGQASVNYGPTLCRALQLMIHMPILLPSGDQLARYLKEIP